MKNLRLFAVFVTFLLSACAANATGETDGPFTLKKGESKRIGEFNIKLLSVGHTFGGKSMSVYASLEITGKGGVSKTTLDTGETVPLGDKFLKLNAVNETADPKLSDPFAATSCTLSAEDKPAKSTEPTIERQPTPTPVSKTADPKIKPTIVKLSAAKVRLGYGKKTAVVDLDDTSDVTLGGESNHRIKLYFTAVKDDKIYYLLEVQSGPTLSNPNGPCGGDSPHTLVWLKTDLSLKVEAAQSEVFASCAYNGGRYLKGKVNVTAAKLRLSFEQQRKTTEIIYDNSMPDKGFELKEIK